MLLRQGLRMGRAGLLEGWWHLTRIVWVKLWYPCPSVGHRGRCESASGPIPPKLAFLTLEEKTGDAYKD